MKLYYFNDEKQHVTVKVMDLSYDYVNIDANSNNLCQLGPAEGRTFDLTIPDGSILWIKKWPGIVMLSYVFPSALPQSEEHLPRSGAV